MICTREDQAGPHGTMAPLAVVENIHPPWLVPFLKEILVKTLKTWFLALTLAAFAAGAVLVAGLKPAAAAPPAPPAAAQTKCPVLGGNIDKQVFADYQGQRIYFCCRGCDAEFKKNPEKYLQKLKEEGVTLESSPAGAAQ
jgi:YHS domain-containing protein